MLNALIDLLMSCFRPLPAEVGLVCYGAMTGFLALLIFRVASRPARIVRARNRVLARVVELWLYRHDPLQGLCSIGWMLIDNLRYLAVLLPPMAICLLPLCLLFAQGRDWLAFRALKPGETMLVVARLRPDAPLTVLNDSELIVDGTTLALDAPPVRTPDWREVAWSVKAEPIVPTTGEMLLGQGKRSRSRRAADEGPLTRLLPQVGYLVIRTGDVELRKTAVAAGGLARRPPRRTGSRLDRLLHPGEARLAADAPFAWIETRWPAAEYNLCGWRTDWLRGLLVTSLMAGLILKKPLRVEF